MSDELIADANACLAHDASNYAERKMLGIIRRLVSRVEANPPLAWSDTKPTESGWYWWRKNEKADSYNWLIYNIYPIDDGPSLGVERGTHIDPIPDGQFAGPIPQPGI